MKQKLITAAAVLMLATAAAQADPPPPPAGKAEMPRPDRCSDRPARTAGEIAFLEAKLQLTATQKPLFERWKTAKLAAAKNADCAPPVEGEPSIVDHMKREEAMLRQRLAELKAEQAPLEALVASLTEEQKQAFAPPHRPHGDHRGGPHDAAPPPPEH